MTKIWINVVSWLSWPPASRANSSLSSISQRQKVRTPLAWLRFDLLIMIIFNKCECIHELFNTHSGGDFDGLDTLKTRLLPWLGSCFALSRPSVTSDTSLQLIQVQYLNTVFSSTRWYTYLLRWPRWHHLLLSGIRGEGPKDQGALGLPWFPDAEDGHWAVLHTHAAGLCQGSVGFNSFPAFQPKVFTHYTWFPGRFPSSYRCYTCPAHFMSCLFLFQQIGRCSGGTQ